MYHTTVLIMLLMTLAEGEVNVQILERQYEHSLDKFEQSAEKHSNNEILRTVHCRSMPITPDYSTDIEEFKYRFRGIKWNIVLKDCAPPSPPNQPSIKVSLESYGYLPGFIKRLELRDVPKGTRFNASHFTGLDWIEILKVHTTGNDRPQQLDDDFIVPLTNVSWLTLENEALPPLPENIGLGGAVLVGGRSLGAWGGCKHLKILHLNDWRLPPPIKDAGNWLAKCEWLKYLKAERMEHDSLKAVLDSVKNLTELQLQYNNLTTPELAALIQNSDKVMSLDISYNSLTHLDNVLENLPSVIVLNMSYNLVTDFNTLRSLSKARVRQFWLDYNPLSNLCDLHNVSKLNEVHRTDLPTLSKLSLVGVGATKLCFADWKSLRVLNLTKNKIKELQFHQLPMIKKGSMLIVDLRWNPLNRVNFTEKDYYALKGASNSRLNYTHEIKAEQVILTVYTDPLPTFHCNCQNGWMARAMRENLLAFSNDTLCQGGGLLSAAPTADLECDLLPCVPCRCIRHWPGYEVSLHCEALGFRDLLELPEQLNIGEMYLRGNGIESIRDVPVSVKILDLRENKITRVGAETMAALLKVPKRRVLLAGNPLSCDCDNWPLLDTLRVYRFQVDYENITCGPDGPSLFDVTKEQLCGVGVWPGVSVGGGVLLGLAALSGALYLRYDRQIKVWLYIHGWCLCCVLEQELDSDREYDAFLSFAHGDYEFIASQLLPQLEKDQRGYKVCVHYRDWIPGELIPTQISRSVAKSRRTVIVLSAHFVKSVWGLIEFRAAHVSALAEKRVRVLVVALDDTPPIDELPEELRLYLRSTTYLRWDDPWFWDKFRYALPHRVGKDKGNKDVETARDTNPDSGIEFILYD